MTEVGRKIKKFSKFFIKLMEVFFSIIMPSLILFMPHNFYSILELFNLDVKENLNISVSIIENPINCPLTYNILIPNCKEYIITLSNEGNVKLNNFNFMLFPSYNNTFISPHTKFLPTAGNFYISTSEVKIFEEESLKEANPFLIFEELKNKSNYIIDGLSKLSIVNKEFYPLDSLTFSIVVIPKIDYSSLSFNHRSYLETALLDPCWEFTGYFEDDKEVIFSKKKSLNCIYNPLSLTALNVPVYKEEW